MNFSSSTRLTSAITYLKGQRWQRPTSLGCGLACIAGCAWLLGKTVWFIPEQMHGIPTWTPAHVTVSQKSSNIDIVGLKQAELFGHYVAPEKAPAHSVAVDAPKTRLNLILVGVVSSSSDQSSLAVISHQGSQDTYGIDETIEGTSVKLKAVLPDRVIIENGGRDETVMLNGLDYTKPSMKGIKAGDAPTGQVSPQQLRVIRQEVQKNPSAILKYVHMSQLKQGPVIMGYKLTPGANKALFTSIGLQPGDVATKVNGIDLTAQGALTKVMGALSNSKAINLTVERDNQVRTIEFEL